MSLQSTSSFVTCKENQENWFFNEAKLYKKRSLETDSSIASESSEVNETYQVYPERWWLLFTVVTLSLSRSAHWVAFPAVAKKAAKHYDQPGDLMDLIPTVAMACGIPSTLIAPYVVDRFGLKFGLRIGGALIGIGWIILSC